MSVNDSMKASNSENFLDIRPNDVIIYGLDEGVGFIKECVSRMLVLAASRISTRKDMEFGSGLNSGGSDLLVEFEEESLVSIWKLSTKYYEATLKAKIVLIDQRDDVESIFNYQEETIKKNQAAIVISSSNKQICDSHLKPLIHRLSSLDFFELNQLILHSEISAEDEDDAGENSGYQNLCLENGFEFHCSVDLSEASMSLQCCPWKFITRHSSTNKKSESSPKNPKKIQISSDEELDRNSPSQSINPSNPAKFDFDAEDDLDDINSSRSQRREGKNATKDLNVSGFDDDFTPFVSAESNNHSNWKPEDDGDFFSSTRNGRENSEQFQFDINDEELLKMERLLFKDRSLSNLNRNPSNYHDQRYQKVENDGNDYGRVDELEDFSNLISNLSSLKDLATGMEDDESRKKLAETVALALQNKFFTSEN